MAGLLDMVNDPRQAFMTQLGMGLLSAGGPSTKPVSFGQAFGAAMGPALKGAQQAQEYQLAQEEARRKQMAESQRQQTISQFIASLPPEQQAIARANPEKAIEAFYKAQEDYTLPPGSVRYRGGKPLVSAPFKPAEPSEFERTLIAAGMQPGSPGYMAAMSDYVRKQTTHAPGTTIDLGGKGAAEAWKGLGSSIPERETVARQAANSIPKIQKIRSLIPSANLGAGAGLKDKYDQIASFLGVSVPRLEAGQTIDNARTNLTAAVAKTFGTNPSVYETQLLQLLTGDRAMEPGAFNAVLDALESDAREKIDSYNAFISRFPDQNIRAFSVDQPSAGKPKSKQFSVDGGKVIGTLGADGNYYVTRNGKRFRIEE